MHNSSIELEKAIVNVRAFLPHDDDIIKIIEICELKPTDDWKRWKDNAGNRLIINKNKAVSTLKHNLYNRKLNTITDIHFKSSIKQIASNSSWAMVSFAKSHKEAGNNNLGICYIWTLGQDTKLRLFVFMKNDWIENQMPLISGIKTLRTIVKNIDIEEDMVIIGSNKIRGPYPSKITKTWITQWPPGKHTMLDMLLTNKLLAQRVLKDSGVL